MSAIFDPASLLVIPGYGRPDLAFTEELNTGASASQVYTIYTVKGKYFDIVRSVTVTFATSAVVANRDIRFIIGDANGGTIFSTVTPSTIPANTSATLTFAANIGGSYSVSPVAGAIFQVVNLPSVILQSAWALTLVVDNFQAGDLYTSSGIQVVHIPTGPTEDKATQARVVTPVLI